MIAHVHYLMVAQESPLTFSTRNYDEIGPDLKQRLSSCK
jgi:hypothetical protein